MKIRILYNLILSAALVTSAISCKNTFDLTPKDVLTAEQVYNNVSDADAAIYAVYGKFIGLADRYVILNELRADLMDITTRSNRYLKELSTHNVSPNNPYINPKPFYEVILSCNDILTNLQGMREEGVISEVDFQERFSDIGCLRSWVYLQLGIHYGTIPYVTKPIKNIDDLSNQQLFPRLNFDQLIAELAKFTGTLPVLSQYKNGTSTITLPSGGAVGTDGVPLNKIFIYRRIIAGDLYLWNNEYVEAAKQYREILNNVQVSDPSNNTQWTISWAAFNGGAWGNIFTTPFNTGSISNPGYNQEWVWSIPFHKDYKPENPFIDLFSYNNGSYQLKPSSLAIKNWESQDRGDGTPGDFRGWNASIMTQSGQPVVRKFLGLFDPLKPLEKTGIWYINRAADLHMRIAEAANRDGKNRLAYSLLTYELKYIFDPFQGYPLYFENTGRDFKTDWPTNQPKRNLAKIMRTPYVYPFNFDASEHDFPFARAQFRSHYSIRTRVGLPILRIDSAKFFDMTLPKSYRFVSATEPIRERPVLDAEGLMRDMEDKILNEGALELAFEGHRWQTLMRIARRQNNPAILAKRVAQKFRAANDNATADAVEAKLMNPANWFLPFDFK